jgi:hypothetical protein
MKQLIRLTLLAAGGAALILLPACTTAPLRGTPYKVTAYRPANPGAVQVKVSTSTQNIYVMEGDKCLMAVQGCVGANGSTPMGTHHIFAKLRNKRSYSYGFTGDGRPADAHKGQSVAVGYPMAYWCEFAPAYGFHEGFVWPIPRTHGCIRMHKEAAARFFQLVQIGTPVHVAVSQPEDATIGKTVRRLDQSRDPDPPTSLLMSARWFQDPPGPLFVN